MDESTYEQVSDGKHLATFLAGLLIGGLASALAILLWAPQSGKDTRKEIQQKALELYNQTTASVEGALAQVRDRAGQIKANVSDKAKEIKLQGQDVLIEQLDRVSAAAKTGKKAIQGKAS
jgi:gas vesicle protein